MTSSKKLIIGTAQFGQNYGITNLIGKVAEKEIISIFKKARANDINTLDTASSYGDSEKILGTIGVTDFDVMTKLPSFEGISSNFEEFCEKALVMSLTQLKLSCVDAVLLHRPEELLGSHGDAIFGALNGLKDKGLVRRIGISIYSPEILNMSEREETHQMERVFVYQKLEHYLFLKIKKNYKIYFYLFL